MDIEKGYNDNPYHSFYHAVDVVMVLYHFLDQYDIGGYLNRIDVAILVIAALCHDIGHPGKNNQFEIARKSKLAKEFNNLSVLESSSSKLTLELIDKHDLIRHIESKSTEYHNSITQSEFKRCLVEMILATDMKCHFNLLYNLSILRKSKTPTFRPLFSPSEDPISYFKDFPTCQSPRTETDLPEKDHDGLLLGRFASQHTHEERMMLCKILIHGADVSNPCRPWKVFSELSQLVCIEFFRQAKEEVDLNMPPHMDISSSASKINVGFIDFIVYPYFESLAKSFPKASELLETCAANREEYLKHSSDQVDLDSPISIQFTLGRPALVAPPGTVEIPKSVELDIQRKRLMQRSISYNHSIVHAPICFRRQSEELNHNYFNLLRAQEDYFNTKKQKIA